MNRSNYPDPLDESALLVNRSRALRRKAYITAVVIPICLAINAGWAFVVWHISLKWAIASSIELKIFWGGAGFILIGVGLIFAFMTISFTRWLNTDQWFGIKPSISKLLLPQAPKRPFRNRLKTLLIMFPIFLLFDFAVVILSLAVISMIGIILAPTLDAVTLLGLGLDVLIVMAFTVYFAYLQVSYFHWVVSGSPVTSWKDFRDWSTKA